jgi:DNA ligase-1
MRKFARLVGRLIEARDGDAQTRMITEYFRQAAPENAAWALHLLLGNTPGRLATSAEMLAWAREEAGLPVWLVEECLATAGDAIETASLILPRLPRARAHSLHELFEVRLNLPPRLPVELRKELMVRIWREMEPPEILVFNRLIAGGLRLGQAKPALVAALAKIAGVDPPVMAHRLIAASRTTVAHYLALTAAAQPGGGPPRAYPFQPLLASDHPASEPGDCGGWRAEWMWPGVRAQLVRRQGQTLLWSDEEVLLGARFPEIVEAGRLFEEGIVIEGIIAAWSGGRALPIEVLEKRLTRAKIDGRLRAEAPVVFVAWDLLESGRTDLRALPLRERRRRLDSLMEERVGASMPARRSVELAFSSWAEVRELQATAGQHGAEGLLMRAWDSPYGVDPGVNLEIRNSGRGMRPAGSFYGVDRARSVWRLWKKPPNRIDAVLISAESGPGGLNAPLAKFTFGVWKEGRLVAVAETGAELAAEEMVELEARVRTLIRGRYGRALVLEPELVVELAFDGVRLSARREAEFALRRPRMVRWRREKSAREAGRVEALRDLLRPNG